MAPHRSVCRRPSAVTHAIYALARDIVFLGALLEDLQKVRHSSRRLPTAKQGNPAAELLSRSRSLVLMRGPFGPRRSLTRPSGRFFSWGDRSQNIRPQISQVAGKHPALLRVSDVLRSFRRAVVTNFTLCPNGRVPPDSSGDACPKKWSNQ
jgi:hypothetical protein